MVEQSPEKACVGGSIPSRATTLLKYKGIDVGKIMIDKPYSFALIKVVEPNLKEFINIDLMCGKSKVKILKPDWI